MLALLAWLFLPRSARLADTDGSGGGTEKLETSGSDGTVHAKDGGAGGPSPGSVGDGDAQGDSKTSGTGVVALTGDDEQPHGQRAQDSDGTEQDEGRE